MAKPDYIPLTDRYKASAAHALEVHMAACCMFAEMQWRRQITNQPRDEAIEVAVREGCEALIRAAQDRRNNPLAHDYNPE